MPTDTRRLAGPESSQSPCNFATINKLNIKELERRADGRSFGQLRPLFVRTGVVSQARGSSYIEMSETKAICAVYGPREVIRREDFSLKGQLTCDLKFTTFSCRLRRQHQQDSQEKDMSVLVLEALGPAVCLDKYPKSQINIFITVLQHDGSALPAAIMCATVALASAGIEMYDLVTASSCLVYDQLSLTDPLAQEEEAITKSTDKQESNAGVVTVAYLPSLGQISAISTDGELSFDMMKKSITECVASCQKLSPVLEHTLVKHQQNTDVDGRNGQR